jgi:ABC-type transport system involved in cytochrome c biogenesis permease subunit
VITFLALLGVAIAISGAVAFVFFWPMALVHLRDRHAARLQSFGAAAFVAPAAIVWLLSGRYRELADPALNGLATPARLSLWSVIFSLIAAALLALFAQGGLA